MERKEPALLARLPGRLCRCLQGRVGQSLEFLGRGDMEREFVGVLELVLLELQRQHAQFLHELAEAHLLVLRERSPVALETLIEVVQQPLILHVKAQALVLDSLDALEVAFVEHDVLGVLREQGLHLLCQRIHLVVGMGTEQVEERRGDPFQGAVIERVDGVLERRRFGIVQDALQVSILAAHALEHGLLVVLETDLVEGNRLVGGGVFV